MTSLLRRSLVAATALALTGTLAACGSSSDDSSGSSAADGKPVLRVGVQKDGIRSVLKAAGLLENLPYTIEWSEFTAGLPIVEAAAADQIDVAWVGGVPPIFGAASDANFKVVAAVHEADKQNDSILVPKGSDIHSIADLKGKKIAVFKGSSADGLMLTSLAQAGLTLKDVQPQYLAPADGLAAFKTGQVDAYVTWDPFVAQAQVEDGAVDLTAATNTVADDAWRQFEVASSKSLDDAGTRANIASFVKLVGQGFDWAKSHSDQWAQGWSDESGIPVDILKKVTARKQSTVEPVSAEDITATQELADRFTEAGEIPKTVDIKSIVDSVLE